ncbi:MAG TPA: hypothetical protein VNU71_22620 [Burkholderiaceae bacterium]|nr:hypothetical protein [Burkholderiaceae bacterium]
MKSRLLSRFDADIRAAESSRQADCLRCERAAYLARLGEGESAARELAEVQGRNAARPDPWISAWWHFAEALVVHFGELSSKAHDRMKRAHALAGAAGHRPLQALTAAWLAQFEYHAMRPEPMATYAASALSLAEPDHHAARARACLVVAEAYHDGGDFERARPWYEEAHRHATVEGDDTMLSAIMSTMTSLRIAALQYSQASGVPLGGDGERAAASAESVARFDAAFGVAGLAELAPILRAQVLTLNGRTEEALVLYEAHLEPAIARGYGMVEGGLLADRAWCRWRAGQPAAARDDADAADRCLERPGSPSDVGAARDRLREVFSALGDASRARRQDVLARQAWEEYRTLQAALVASMSRALDGIQRT